MIRLVLLDLDGTVYRGREPFPEAISAVKGLVEMGVIVRYLTNNSALTQRHLAERLQRMGFPAEESWCYGTGPASAELCRSRGYRSALVVGEPGLKEAFMEAGLQVVGPDAAEVVVVGVCRSFDYDLIDQALQALLGGAAFLATNTDPTYPLEEGRFQPGAGAMVAAIATASQRQPEVVGKPAPAMLLQAIAEAGCAPQETLAVGDRLDTDLAAAAAAGCRGLLTLTGATSAPVDGVDSVPDLSHLRAYLESLA